MTALPPEDLDWDETDYRRYEAELVLELYLQGRTYQEVSNVTDCPAATVRELARMVGLMRAPGEDIVLSRWRSAARAKLATMPRAELVHAWMDGAEPEELANRHGVPADLMWDLIADEMARMTRRDLRRRPVHRAPREPLTCAGTCTFACTGWCALTARTSDGAKPPGSELAPNAQTRHSNPPSGRISGTISFSPSGRAIWRGKHRDDE